MPSIKLLLIDEKELLGCSQLNWVFSDFHANIMEIVLKELRSASTKLERI